MDITPSGMMRFVRVAHESKALSGIAADELHSLSVAVQVPHELHKVVADVVWWPTASRPMARREIEDPMMRQTQYDECER